MTGEECFLILCSGYAFFTFLCVCYLFFDMKKEEGGRKSERLVVHFLLGIVYVYARNGLLFARA